MRSHNINRFAILRSSMKKQSLIFITLVILIGCATVQAERHVVDNVIYSTYPAVNVAIAPEFQYNYT